ncbi:MAG: type II toxin-antitoxin system RelE/ParE family toxin [Melioribacteraceae bacterium]|nr:type II toxin-antitoxin system RelE/ParE family toxin [Melioribacteraceae bacterium]
MPEANFYQSESGKYPAIEFLDSLSGKQAQKIAWVLELFEEMSVVPKQYFKKLKNTTDIWEIRIIFSETYSDYLVSLKATIIFITNGFIKKSQKTPQSEINLAEDRRKYYERKNK